jgi:hypothetical protein
MNSTPAPSSARRIALTVEGFRSSPRSSLAIVSVDHPQRWCTCWRRRSGSCVRLSSACPTPHRPHRMRRMHRITKQHRFIIANVVQQVLVTLDESSLLVRVQLGGHRFWLAMLHVQPVQQGDQPRPALIGDAAFCLDPGANLAGCPRQRFGDPGLRRPRPDAADTKYGRCRRPTTGPSRHHRNSSHHPTTPARWCAGPTGEPPNHRGPAQSGRYAIRGQGSRRGSPNYCTKNLLARMLY